jgi:hypothetical protein
MGRDEHREDERCELSDERVRGNPPCVVRELPGTPNGRRADQRGDVSAQAAACHVRPNDGQGGEHQEHAAREQQYVPRRRVHPCRVCYGEHDVERKRRVVVPVRYEAPRACGLLR